jgi:hypothetical protein
MGEGRRARIRDVIRSEIAQNNHVLNCFKRITQLDYELECRGLDVYIPIEAQQQKLFLPRIVEV